MAMSKVQSLNCWVSMGIPKSSVPASFHWDFPTNPLPRSHTVSIRLSQHPYPHLYPHYILIIPIIPHYIPLYPIISHYIPLYPIISHYIPLYPIIPPCLLVNPLTAPMESSCPDKNHRWTLRPSCAWWTLNSPRQGEHGEWGNRMNMNGIIVNWNTIISP